jgi:hypothetical protein
MPDQQPSRHVTDGCVLHSPVRESFREKVARLILKVDAALAEEATPGPRRRGRPTGAEGRVKPPWPALPWGGPGQAARGAEKGRVAAVKARKANQTERG